MRRQQIIGGILQVVTAVQYLEQQLVALLAILAHQRGQVLDGGSFNLLETIEKEYVFNRVEYIVASRHLDGREVTSPFRDRWFLCHYLMKCIIRCIVFCLSTASAQEYSDIV